MKHNIYIFSNTVLRRKNNTLCIEQDTDTTAVHESDIDESEILVTPTQDNEGYGKKFVPADNVEAIYTFGSVKTNSQFYSMTAKYSIPVYMFNYYGSFIGSFFPKADISSGNILLSQVEHFNNEQKRVEVAKVFIKGAACNSLSNMQYYQYRNAPVENEIAIIRGLAGQIDDAKSIGELLGTEGNIKHIYYQSWKKFLRQEVSFDKRVRRPPDNMVNSLISFGNMMLYTVCLNEIFRTGLVPSIGYLHTPGDNRFPLSYDLSEIFKPVIVDKAIFRVINLNMVEENDFVQKGDYFYMKEKAKKTFVEAIETRLKTTIMHPDLKRHVSYKTLIRFECHKLIKHLKGIENFNPYISEA